MFAVRVPFAAASGVLLAAAVFLGLFNLVNVPFDGRTVYTADEIIFTPQRRDTPIDNKRDPKIERTPPPVTQIISDPRWPEAEVKPEISIQRTRAEVVRPDHNGLPVGSDRDVIPLVRVAPDYPPRLLTSGTEGWVQVQFSITPTGMVRDPVVVASEPGSVFDEAALKAIARWRYNPRVEGGQAVERVGLQTVIRFELEN
jgi:periplasmic protein TonB